MKTLAKFESKRLALQKTCDDAKTPEERNRFGQFATPPALALEILRLAKTLLPIRQKVRFLDPAFGTGSFYSALNEVFGRKRIETAMGFEIDPHYADGTSRLWKETVLDLRVGDFTRQQPPQSRRQPNLVVCNPPYVRHHHLSTEDKYRLRNCAREASGANLSGLSGLYCYFLLISHGWCLDGGLCLWLVPSEFMDVNYGTALKRYLLNEVTLLRVHRFDASDVQFGDALVSSSVVCFRKSAPRFDHEIEFSFGGSLSKPASTTKIAVSNLRPESKWKGTLGYRSVSQTATRLADLFEIKRGLATGSNEFFICTPEKIRSYRLPTKFLKPILPGPRFLLNDEIEADDCGNPVLDRRLFLLDCQLSEGAVEREYPNLWRYLQTGKDSVATGYLCRMRSPWYSQENRPAPMFLCTYMGRSGKRNAPFRFILNHSNATAANVYLLLYPRAEIRRVLDTRPEAKTCIWKWLTSISAHAILGEGRLYGGGLHKIEPKELGNVPADGLEEALGVSFKAGSAQLDFFTASGPLSAATQ